MFSKKNSKISIENGPRQGFQYIDSLGIEYNYRYITATITNDSTVPIHLQVSFSKEYNYLRSNKTLLGKVFLLPRKLTPDKQNFDVTMSKELKLFLDEQVDKPISLDELINPHEKIVMTFGLLNDEKYGEYMRMELISSDEQFHLNSHDSLVNVLNSFEKPIISYLGLNLVNSFIIPCGQFSFSK